MGVIFILLFIVFYITLRDLRRLRAFSGHHGPPTYPLIGCLIPFYKNRNRLLDWYTHLLSNSPTYTIVLRRLGAPTTIVTANPQNVKYILKTNFNNFPKGKRFTDILGDFLGHGIFNVDGEQWKTQRTLASHEFSSKSLGDFVKHTLEEEVNKRLIPVLETLSKRNQVVDLQDLLGRFSFSVICKFTIGITLCCLDPCSPISPLARAFDVASELSARRGAAPLFLIWKMKRWLGVGSERRLRDAVEEVQGQVMEMIRERKKKTKALDDDLLSRLVRAGEEDEVIRDMMISFILAGKDTTAAALTWFFWLVSHHPATEHQIVKETELNVGEEVLDYESLRNLDFLKACLCESMRLYPPVAWDSKHAIEDDLLPDGTKVKAGDRVTYFPYGMGRMAALWGKDRFEFRPDRWYVETDESKKRSNVSAFKCPTFQAGPRTCLGKEMAFIQMKYVVASILRRFKIRPVCQDKPVYVPFLTAHMAGGLKVLVCKRENLP